MLYVGHIEEQGEQLYEMICDRDMDCGQAAGESVSGDVREDALDQDQESGLLSGGRQGRSLSFVKAAAMVVRVRG